MTFTFWGNVGFAITVALVVAGLRQRGRARFFCLSAAAVALLLTFWYDVVQSVNTQLPQSQGQSAAATQQSAAARAVQSLGNSLAQGDGTVRWHGRVVIPASGGLELDHVPPQPTKGIDGDISTGPGGQAHISGSVNSFAINTAPWTGPAFPTQGQCSTQLESDPQLQITVRPGSVVCVLTAAGRIAALKFTSVTGDRGSDVAEATVWQ